jgi:hypothetical protein
MDLPLNHPLLVCLYLDHINANESMSKDPSCAFCVSVFAIVCRNCIWGEEPTRLLVSVEASYLL